MKKTIFINKFGLILLMVMFALGVVLFPSQGEAGSVHTEEEMLRRARPKYVDKYVIGNANSPYLRISGVYYLTNQGSAIDIDLHATGKEYTVEHEYYYPEGGLVRCIVMYSNGGAINTINILL